MNIFDLVSAKNIAQYWIEKNVNAQPLLGETLFPYQKDVSLFAFSEASETIMHEFT